MQRYDFFFNNQQFIIRAPQNATPLLILLLLLILLILLTLEPPAPQKTKKGVPNPETPYKRLAATYFPTNTRSIIGDAGLNFSVRNGKRCSPAPRPPRIVLPAPRPATIGTRHTRAPTESLRVISTARHRHRCPYTCGLSRS